MALTTISTSTGVPSPRTAVISTRDRAVLEELAREVLALVVAGERRDLVGGDAEDLRRGVAVEPLGARVPVGDAEVRVGPDDAVVEHVEHVEQPGLKLLWHVRGPRLVHAARATHRWRIRTRLRADSACQTRPAPRHRPTWSAVRVGEPFTPFAVFGRRDQPTGQQRLLRPADRAALLTHWSAGGLREWCRAR